MIGPGQVGISNVVKKICTFFLDFLSLLTAISYDAAVYFLYDLSPIIVTIKEERRSFLHFITRLCAVLGGTFALTGYYLYLL